MKKLLYLCFISSLVFVSCKKDKPGVDLQAVTVQLVYPAGSGLSATTGVTVKASTTTSTFEATTDATGKAVFAIPAGLYEFSASETRTANFNVYVYNGLKSNVSVTSNWPSTDIIPLELTESKSSQVVIKEIFVGGSPNNAGTGTFAYDKYITLYNNSTTPADLSNVCLGMVSPFNSNATNNYYGTDGKLIYEAENWIPAVQAFWYFTSPVTLQPGKQIVIALNNAVNNTITYTKSINFDNAEYYCTYDVANFSHAATYVSPSASIPTSHYLKAQKYATATAWALSATTPGPFLFKLEGTTPAAFAADASSTHVLTTAYTSKKIPVDWVLDGVEGYLLNNTSNKKRFTANVDAGYVYHDNGAGYSIYRNVDKAATEAIAANAGKIVYSYALGTTDIGTGGTTDLSGIDAEASIRNGAVIIYQDKNNSTLDFHLRKKAALSNY
ncbi:MAG: DUF4876 domain-containing protein [Ferruginibacter sp.]